MRRLIILLIVIIASSSMTSIFLPGNDRVLPGSSSYLSGKTGLLLKLQEKAKQARTYAKQQQLDGHICFLIDMQMSSNLRRFFVYDLDADTVRRSGLVAHGRCNENWLEGRRYSNEVGCGCTSLGHYKIGYPYTGQYGYAYKLYGLDSTNNNAFQRNVVLHSYTCVPETETVSDICQSNGCPMVAPGFLQQLKPFITTAKKSLLLWIYD